MGKEVRNTTVKIFDRVYGIRTTEDLNYLSGLVDELNERIKAMENAKERVSDIQILSLVALQILDEKAKVEKEIRQMKDLARRMELGSNKI